MSKQKIYNLVEFNKAIKLLMNEVSQQMDASVSFIFGDNVDFPVTINGLMYNNHQTVVNGTMTFNVLVENC